MKNTQRGFIVPVLLGIIAVLLIGGGVYIYENKKSETPISPAINTENTINTETPPVTSNSSSQTTVSGMQQYTDSNLGFSFWYPSSWQVTQASVQNQNKYPGGTVTRQLNITNGQRLITIEEFSSPAYSITDSTGVGACPVCSTTRYYFSPSLDTWMVVYPNGTASAQVKAGVSIAADVSHNTMGGLHLLAGSERFGANTIIPLSASNFLVVTVDGAIATGVSDPQALAKTILALNPKVATPVSQAEQTQTIQAEASAYADISNTSNVSQQSPNSILEPSSALNTYDNFGITFQYPSTFGIPHESFYDANGQQESITFDPINASNTQMLMVYTEQDTNPMNGALENETFDQMIARFRTNDKYIYLVKDLTINGMVGRELFYDNAITGQPYHVDAYFQLINENASYVVFAADYQSVPQDTFDNIISTFKPDINTVAREDSTTGMFIYKNNGIQFEYPGKFATEYADLTVETSVEKATNATLDANGCYPIESDGPTGVGTSKILTINGTRFCYTTGGGVGAGQVYTGYGYTTSRNGNVYNIDYSVHTSNGCGVYENSPDPNAPGNQKYKECLDFQQKYANLVTSPIQASISTFKFTN